MTSLRQIGQGAFVTELASAGAADAWYRLVLPCGVDPTAAAERLRDELRLVLNLEVVILDGEDGPLALSQRVRRARPKPLIIRGVDSYGQSEWGHLDLLRSHLEKGGPKVLLCREAAIGAMENWAPHFTSFIAGATWLLDLDADVLTPTECEGRLRDLREAYGLTDAEVLVMADQGTLPPDPDFAEWRLLLGREGTR